MLKSVDGTTMKSEGIAKLYVYDDSRDEWILVKAGVMNNLRIDADLLLGHDSHELLGDGLVWIWSGNNKGLKYVRNPVGAVNNDFAAADMDVNDDGSISDLEEEFSELPHEQVMGRNEPDLSKISTGLREIGDENFIEESDHRASKSNKRWTASWRWISEAPQWQSEGFQEWYRKKGVSEDQVDAGLKEWLRDGVIEPVSRDKVKFLLTINPVPSEATHKTTKLRLALDFKPLNKFIICENERSTNEDSLRSVREWRRFREGTLVDLKQAYLSVLIDRNQQSYQCIRWRGQYYRCTRLMFGLSSAPRILFRILSHTLKSVKSNVRFFRDDLLVLSQLNKVLECLSSNGFRTKPGQRLGPGSEVRILGLTVLNNEWKRVELYPGYWKLTIPCSYREALKYVARVANIAPIQREVRVVATILRSKIGQLAKDIWSVKIDNDEIYDLLRLLDEIVKSRNPMKGIWCYGNGTEWKLYTDSSKDLLGAVLATSSDEIVADWCKPIKIARQINMNELEALVKGISQLLLKYVKPGDKVNIYCDNSTVVKWVQTWLKDLKMASTADSWPLVERRMVLISEMIQLYNLRASIEYIKSEENIADHLTRLPNIGIETKTVGAISNVNYCPVPVTLRWWENVSVKDQHCLIRKIHSELAHPSISQMQSTINRFFDVEIPKKLFIELVNNCSICCMKKARLPKELPPYPMSVDSQFGSTIQMDCLVIDQQYFYSIIDSISRFAQLYSIPDKPAGTNTREAITAWCAMTGVIPRIIRCDNGSEFARQLSAWADERDVSVRHGAVSNPQAQALVERFHKSLITLVRCLEAGGVKEKAFRGLQIYNLRPHAAFGYRASPLEVKEKLRTKGWQQLDFSGEEIDDDELVFEIENYQVEIDDEIQRHHQFEVGDSVLWKDLNSRKKSQFPWKPGVIKEKYGRGGYLVEFDDGAKRERVINERLIAQKQDVVNPTPIQDDGSEQSFVSFDHEDDEFHELIQDEVSEQSVPPPVLRRSARSHRSPKRYGFE